MFSVILARNNTCSWVRQQIFFIFLRRDTLLVISFEFLVEVFVSLSAGFAFLQQK